MKCATRGRVRRYSLQGAIINRRTTNKKNAAIGTRDAAKDEASLLTSHMTLVIRMDRGCGVCVYVCLCACVCVSFIDSVFALIWYQ